MNTELIEFGTPIKCKLHAERACVCVVTPCPCHCHRVETGAHSVGCVCERCSVVRQRDYEGY